MPHISTKKISDEHFKKIYQQLISLFDTAGTKRKSDLLLGEILTDTEKIMLAKRLSIVYLLDEGVSTHNISDTLSVSPSTVSRISLNYENNKYKYIKNILAKNKQAIWESLEEVIRIGAERYAGKGRWNWLNEAERRYDHKIFKD